MGKVVAGALQGLIAACVVFPIAAFVHAAGVVPHLTIHWLILLTMIPLACVTTASLGLTFGTKFDPRQVPALFALIILPITFLGGTYYAWTTLHSVQIGGFPWLQALVTLNPLIYITEGFRAALTTAPHMHLYVIYPVLVGFAAILAYWAESYALFGVLAIPIATFVFGRLGRSHPSETRAAGVRIAKDEMTVRFQDKNEKFKVSRADAERFNESLSRFQQFYSPANK